MFSYTRKFGACNFDAVHVEFWLDLHAPVHIESVLLLEGLAMIFLVRNAHESFSEAGKSTRLNQKNQQNPHRIVENEIIKKIEFLASFILGGALSRVF